MLTELNSSTDGRNTLLSYSFSCPKCSDDVHFDFLDLTKYFLFSLQAVTLRSALSWRWCCQDLVRAERRWDLVWFHY